MSTFPEMPPELRHQLPEPFWKWWQDFRSFMLARFFTESDVIVLTAGKGVVLKNAAGTVTKRVRLNNAGDGFIFEAP